jgi:hypothetical protein
MIGIMSLFYYQVIDRDYQASLGTGGTDEVSSETLFSKTAFFIQSPVSDE